MALLRFRWLLLACVAALSARAVAVSGESSPRVAPDRQVVKMRPAGQEIGAPRLGNATSRRLEPCDAPPKRLLQEPKYKSNRPIYYAARFGDGPDPVFTLVLDEGQGPGKGYDTLFVDADNDRRIDAEKERFSLRVDTEPIRVRLQVVAGGVAAPYYVSLSATESSDDKFPVPKIQIALRNASYYIGEAVLGGKARMIALADLNLSGLYNEAEQEPFQGDRLFVAGDDGQFRQSFPHGRFTQIAGQWYSIAASPDGGRVEITEAKPPLGTIESPPQVAGARLNSPTQSLDLDFQEGPTQVVAGTYRIHSVQLVAESGWALGATFPEGEPELTIHEGQTVRLPAGLPLVVEPQAVADEDRTLRVYLRITGAGGETYRWSARGGSTSKAGFEILSPAGGRMASAGFEYG